MGHVAAPSRHPTSPPEHRDPEALGVHGKEATEASRGQALVPPAPEAPGDWPRVGSFVPGARSLFSLG